MTAVLNDVDSVLSCRSVTVELGGRAIVRGADLDLRAGEWLAVIGPNGAGKSTLLRAVAGLVAHGGQVAMFDGRRPGPKDIAVVPQAPVLPDEMTVAEYVLMGRTAHLGWLARESRHDREIVGGVLDRLDLTSFAERSVTSLSGGEAQRAVIGRALAQEAPILLLDEPTSSLDIGHESTVLDLVDELRVVDGLSVVAVMHDLTVAARYADRITIVADGVTAAVGTPSEVLTSERLSDVYGSPVTVRHLDGEIVVLPAARKKEPNSR